MLVTNPYENIAEFQISHSSLKLLRSCSRKFEFRKLYELSGSETGEAAGAGIALHAGLQHYFTHRDEDAAIWQFMLHYPYDLQPNPMAERGLEASFATLLHMMHDPNLLEYELATVHSASGQAKPATEIGFKIELPGFSLSAHKNIPVVYIGFIDLILFNRMTGSYLVVDIKTHRRNIEDMTPLYQYDEQCIPYGLILEQLLGKEIRGLTIQYYSVYIDILNPVSKVYTFEKSLEDVKDWARGLTLDLVQLRQMFDMQWFKRNGGEQCMSFNRPCEFLDICMNRDWRSIAILLAAETELVERRKLRDFQPDAVTQLELVG